MSTCPIMIMNSILNFNMHITILISMMLMAITYKNMLDTLLTFVVLPTCLLFSVLIVYIIAHLTSYLDTLPTSPLT